MHKIEDIINTVHCAECLTFMKDIPDKSIDCVISDPPYQVTQNSWDVSFDLEKFWIEINRICRGGIILTSVQPFTTKIISSNIVNFRYDDVWEKNKVTGFLNAKRMPLRCHESILVFGKPIYNPQKTTGHKPVNSYTKYNDGSNYGKTNKGFSGGGSTERYPKSVVKFSVVNNDGTGELKLHPTQKPIALFEYLVRTYSNEGDLILDPFMGSGTTCLAAKNTGRNYIGIEKDEKYFNIAKERIENFVEKKSIGKEKKGFFK